MVGVVARLTALLLAALWLATPAVALLGHGGGGAAVTYTDFCSQGYVGGSCTYAYDVGHRRVSSNTIPFQVTRLSDSATFNAGYTGTNQLVNASALTAFCTGNGGTTTALTYSTQYNDCVYTTLYEQTGSGCDLVAGAPNAIGTTHAPPVQIRASDGLPAIIQSSQAPSTSPSAKFLFASGCTTLTGTATRTLIAITNNAYFSGCCGQYGSIESAPATGNTPAGAMWSAIFYHNGATITFGVDIEGGGGCPTNTTTTLTPVIDSVGVITYSATAGGTNTYLANTLLGPANCVPFHTLTTQSGMVVGCSGDYTACGLMYFRGMIFLNIDASLTAGLPSQIYGGLI
jgi:hypothetical protein